MSNITLLHLYAQLKQLFCTTMLEFLTCPLPCNLNTVKQVAIFSVKAVSVCKYQEEMFQNEDSWLQIMLSDY